MSFVNDYPNYDAVGLAELVRNRQVKAQEVVEAAAATIERLDGKLNAVVLLMREEALRQVQTLDAVASGSPLSGAPIVMKDEYQFIAGVPTSSASRLGQGIVVDYDTELVKRYRRAGVIMLGKSNLPEFGSTVMTESVLNGTCRNPWNTDLGVGGSSGGSGCAVAAGMVPFAYANDGGGSIRIPASCNGVFGLKPTRARVPCGPDVSELWNGMVIEHAITRTVRDSAALLDATAGADIGAPYWAPPIERPYLQEIARPTGKLRIALRTGSFHGIPVHPECVRAAEATAKLCQEMGHEVVEDSPPFDGVAVGAAYARLLAMHLAAGFEELAAFTGRTPSRQNIEKANWLLGQWGGTMKASEMLAILGLFSKQSRQCAQFFTRYDLLLTPTLAAPPMPHGTVCTDNEIDVYTASRRAMTSFTPIANVLGNPAMSVPLYWTADNVPIGSQFIARFGEEATLFRLAAALEEARPWRDRHPPVSAWRLAAGD